MSTLATIDVEPLAQAVAARALEIIAEHKFNPPPDPLLNTRQIAERLDVSETKVRELVAGGWLRKAPGMIEIRVRQSEVDAYGKPDTTGRQRK